MLFEDAYIVALSSLTDLGCWVAFVLVCKIIVLIFPPLHKYFLSRKEHFSWRDCLLYHIRNCSVKTIPLLSVIREYV